MSASEKLKALAEEFAKNGSRDDDLDAVLPQIVAVVEAAEPALAQWLMGRANWNEGRGAMTSEERALKDALTALEEALS